VLLGRRGAANLHPTTINTFLDSVAEDWRKTPGGDSNTAT
jgi:hypothetical protein